MQPHAACLYGSPFGQNAFEQKIMDLQHFLAGTPPLNPEWRTVKATPITDHHPQLWSLGSGESSAAFAARHGMALSFAHFINPYIYADVIAASENISSRQCFIPSQLRTFVCMQFAVIQKRRYASVHPVTIGGRSIPGLDPPYRSVEKGLSYPYSEAQLEKLAIKRDAVVIGTPEQVRAQIEAIAAAAQVDEVMIQTMCFDFSVRLRSFELIAEAFRG